MFNLGFSELLLLGLIALIFIGPNQLPEVARTIGRLLNEWKRATSDFQDSITTHITDDLQNRRVQTEEEFQRNIAVPGNGHFESGQKSPEEQLELPIGAHPVSEDDEKKKS